MAADEPAPLGSVSYADKRVPAAHAAAAARRLVGEARQAQARGDDPEPLLRQAIEAHVDAFLLDRHGQADCFAHAHAIGRALAGRSRCALSSDDAETWGRNCGVLALHNRLGLSMARTTRGRCSICDAPDFGCEHVPGATYDGEPCVRQAEVVGIKEVSIVQFPEDPRCYRLFVRTHNAEVERRFGGPLPQGVVPVCTHCLECRGVEDGPSPEDMDQSLWPRPQTPVA
jgi:hypothetical protein